MISTCVTCCPPYRLEKIRSAFKQTGSPLISSIKDILGDDYSYEESRVVHLYLQQQDRTTRSGQPDVTDRRKALPVRRTARDIDEVRRKRNQKTMREGSTYEKTRQMWEQGLSVKEIARKRGVKERRVVYHLQRLIDAGVDVDLRQGLPPAERVEEIGRAIRETGGASLSPAIKLLGGKYPYYEIKIVWLFLQQQGELPN